MAIILIVDDDKTFLLSLAEGLKAHDREFEIKTAANGKIATQVLQEESVDLIITDLKMPVMDGFELLAYMSSHHPRIPVIVMTAYGTPSVESSISHLGAVRYLEKPLDFNLLVDNIYNIVKASDDVKVSGIQLISFLKLIQLEKKTCILTIRNHSQAGKMFLRKGVLIHATVTNSYGETAVMEMLDWEHPEIQVSSKSFSVEKNVQHDLAFISMVLESRRRSRPASESARPSPVSSYDTELDDIFNIGEEVSRTVPSEAAPAVTTDALPPDDQAEEGSFSTAPVDEFGPGETVESENDLSGDRAPSAIEDMVDTEDGPVEDEKCPPDLPREGETLTQFTEGKENAVNIKKLNEAINTLKESAGAGLISCDVYTSRDGQSIMSYNGNETYCAMSNQITQYMLNSIKEAGFPSMGNTYMIDLAGDKMVVVLVMDEYQWGILIDTKKTSLGILLNVALPKAKAIFADALAS
ncbi:MAG: response regulator [Syntrophales bacterium]|nr:response regulator [Syntrophales bacterium]